MILEHRMMSRNEKRIWGGAAVSLLIAGVVLLLIR